MLLGAPTRMITTIRVMTGTGTCVILAIMYRVKKAGRVASQSVLATSSSLPAPYISERADMLLCRYYNFDIISLITYGYVTHTMRVRVGGV